MKDQNLLVLAICGVFLAGTSWYMMADNGRHNGSKDRPLENETIAAIGSDDPGKADAAKPIGEQEFLEQPVVTDAGRLSTECINGMATILLNGRKIGSFAECTPEYYSASIVQMQRFADKSSVYIFGSESLREHGGIRLANGQFSTVISLGFSNEVSDLPNSNSAVTAIRGTDENMETIWRSCTFTLDWEAGKIISAQEGQACLPD